MLLEACLNGARSRSDHARCPITPAELAAEARDAVAAGAGAIHVHPRDRDGRESVDPDDVGAAVEAIRAAVDAPIGVSTGAWIAAAPGEISAAVRRWTVLADFASVKPSGGPW